MIRYIFVLVLFFMSMYSVAQEQMMIDENTTIIDENGEKTTLMASMSKLQSGEYTLEPILNDDGSLKEAKLKKLNAEEQAEMKKRMEAFKAQSDLTGQPVPEFSFTDINGKKYSKKDLKGKVVVMNFWFMQCKPCVMEMPDLNKLVAKYKDNKDVVFLAPTFNEKEKVLGFLERKKFDYAIVTDERKTVDIFGVNSFPTNFVMDKEGRYEMYSSGGYPGIDKTIDASIQSALKK